MVTENAKKKAVNLMTNWVEKSMAEAECFKCGAHIWVPGHEYVSDRNFCYPCASSYMGHTTGVSLEELDKVRADMEVDNA